MIRGTLGLILVAAGSSRRMNGIDKVWALLGGQPIVWHSLSRLSPLASATVLVVRADQVGQAEKMARQFQRVDVVAGGAERSESVRCGLAALPATEIIAIHDVARPLVTARLLSDGSRLLDIAEGAVPVMRIVDTTKRIVDSGAIVGTVERDQLRAAQTPQVFRAETIRSVHAIRTNADAPVTDDSSLLEMAGFSVMTFAGAPENFKITMPYDLVLAQLLVESGRLT